jgi:hypothetical protein
MVPVVKFVPILIAEVADEPLIVFTYAVDAFKIEVFVVTTFRSFIVHVDTFRTETLVGPNSIDPVVKLGPIFITEDSSKPII